MMHKTNYMTPAEHKASTRTLLARLEVYVRKTQPRAVVPQVNNSVHKYYCVDGTAGKQYYDCAFYAEGDALGRYRADHKITPTKDNRPTVTVVEGYAARLFKFSNSEEAISLCFGAWQVFSTHREAICYAIIAAKQFLGEST